MPHIHDLIDFTVEVYIVHQDKVLLRLHDKYGIWLSVGGHIELSEDPNQAAMREVKEEVGLDIHLYDKLQQYHERTDVFEELIPPTFLNRHRINDHHEHVTMVYFATSDTDTIIQPEGEEKSDLCRWFTKKELLQNTELRDNIRFYALKALEVLGK